MVELQKGIPKRNPQLLCGDVTGTQILEGEWQWRRKGEQHDNRGICEFRSHLPAAKGQLRPLQLRHVHTTLRSTTVFYAMSWVSWQLAAQSLLGWAT